MNFIDKPRANLFITSLEEQNDLKDQFLANPTLYTNEIPEPENPDDSKITAEDDIKPEFEIPDAEQRMIIQKNLENLVNLEYAIKQAEENIKQTEIELEKKQKFKDTHKS